MTTRGSEELNQFPEIAHGDPDDVRWALETGKAMWGKGDRAEAVKWLKRAAESASEEGADMRAIELGKAAASFRAALEAAPALAPGAQAYPMTSGAPAGYAQQAPAGYAQQAPAGYPQQAPAGYPQQAPAGQSPPPLAAYVPQPAAQPPVALGPTHPGPPPPPPRRSGPGVGPSVPPPAPRRSVPSPPARPSVPPSGAPRSGRSQPPPAASRPSPSSPPRRSISTPPPAPAVPPAAATPAGLSAPPVPAAQAMPQPAPAPAPVLAPQLMPQSAPQPAMQPQPPAAMPYVRPLGDGGTTHPMFEGLPPAVPSAPQPVPASVPQPAASYVAPTQARPTAASPAVAIAEHQALRVAVAAPDAAGELRVKLLGPNEPAPAGTRLGLLVALDAGSKLIG